MWGVIEITADSLGTMVAVSIGFLMVTGHSPKKALKQWKSTASRAQRLARAEMKSRNRAHQQRMAVYEEATEAKRAAQEARMLERQNARKRWAEGWIDAGASRWELDPTFQPYTGPGRTTRVYVNGNLRMSPVVGTIERKMDSADAVHIFAVGLTEDDMTHYDDLCSVCIERKERYAEQRTGQKELSVPDAVSLSLQRLSAAKAVVKNRNTPPDKDLVAKTTRLMKFLEAAGQPVPQWVLVVLKGLSPFSVLNALEKSDGAGLLSEAEKQVHRLLERELEDLEDLK